MVKKIIAILLNRFLKIVVPITPGKILLLTNGCSGSNTFALFSNRPASMNVILMNIRDLTLRKSLKEIWNFRKEVYSCEVVITTHGGPVMNKKGMKQFDLWHGIPLKSMGYMDRAVDMTYSNVPFHNIKRMFSYSDFYSTIMNACIHKQVSFFEVTGMPRNDFLFSENGIGNIRSIFPEISDNQKIIFYMPTYRRDSPVKYNLLQMADIELFDEWLENENIFLICKFHPNELTFTNDEVSRSMNIRILHEKDLHKKNLDLYQLLNGVDLLLTDYSSVYFDLLLIDMPMIFFAPDIEEYKKNVGFLLSPYKEWVPGPIVYDIDILKRYILDILKDPTQFFIERDRIKKIVHKYSDQNNSQRVWDFVQKELE